MLFVGIAILLASTYTTLSTQEQMVQQESVVKVAKPISHEGEEEVIIAEGLCLYVLCEVLHLSELPLFQIVQILCLFMRTVEWIMFISTSTSLVPYMHFSINIFNDFVRVYKVWFMQATANLSAAWRCLFWFELVAFSYGLKKCWLLAKCFSLCLFFTRCGGYQIGC